MLEEGRPLLPDDDEHAVDLAVAALAGIYAALTRGSVAEATDCTEEASSRYEALHQLLGVAYAATYRATLTLFLGDLEAAEQRYRDALELAVRAGDEGLIGEVLSLLGLVLLDRGDERASRQTILDSAVANRQAGEPSSMAASLEGLAALALADGHAEVAARALATTAAARESVATALFPTLAPLVEDLSARTRERLGDEADQSAVAERGQWSLLQGLDRTLTELVRPSS